MSESRIPAFGRVIRDYAFAYTASHDFEACDRLMIEDYVLHMGDVAIRGRDEAYKPATAKQYRQYPGLGFTVHSFMTNGDRAALIFSEHGRSVLTGQLSSWRGISLYRWDGTRLTECRVEQDYYGRRRQSEGGPAHAVPSPGIDPWVDSLRPASPSTEASIRAWLEAGMLFTSDDVDFDDAPEAGDERVRLESMTVTVLDLFSCGDQAAFHIRADGVYAGGLAPEHDALLGKRGSLYATGLVTAAGDSITGHVVSDRLSYTRRLALDV